MEYNLNINTVYTNTVSSIFAVPSLVVDGYITLCNELQLKMLLIALRQPEQKATSLYISSVLGVPESTVLENMMFWINNGVISSHDTPNTLSAESVFDSTPAPLTATQETQTERTKLRPAPPSKPTISDISNIVNANAEVRFLLTESERILAKTLTSSDISSIVCLYDWAGIPIEVILMVEQYCKSKGKANMRYIEKTALAWFEKGITSHEKAERYISELLTASRNEQTVKSALESMTESS